MVPRAGTKHVSVAGHSFSVEGDRFLVYSIKLDAETEIVIEVPVALLEVPVRIIYRSATLPIADYTITYKVEISGVLTDVTNVVLSDSTETDDEGWIVDLSPYVDATGATIWSEDRSTAG